MAGTSGEKLIVDNRRARHEYHLSDRVEAGLVLSGTEVKSLRGGQATLQQAYAEVRDGEAWLVGLHVPEYSEGNRAGGRDEDRAAANKARTLGEARQARRFGEGRKGRGGTRRESRPLAQTPVSRAGVARRSRRRPRRSTSVS